MKAEEEGKEKKEFTLEEVTDRIIALRKTRDRRKSGELPPAKTLDSPKAWIVGRVRMGKREVGVNIRDFWDKVLVTDV